MTGYITKSNQFHQLFVTFAWEYCCNDSCQTLSTYENPKVKLVLVKYCIYRMDLQIEIDHVQNIFPFPNYGFTTKFTGFQARYLVLSSYLIPNLNVYLTEINKTSEF